MRLGSLLALISPVLLLANDEPSLPDGGGIVSNIETRTEHQNATLCSYSAVETYTLRNRHLTPAPEMKVRLTYNRGEGKHFQVLSSPTSSIARHIFNELLTDETTAQRQKANEINSSNYEFAFLGKERCGNRECYKVHLTPRHKTRFLLDGIAFVDVQTYMIVWVTGHLARSPSFWIKAPEVEESFADVQGFSLPSSNHSTAHVLFFGDADLSVAYSDYQVQACDSRDALAMPGSR
jgi:hypothetical protein